MEAHGLDAAAIVSLHQQLSTRLRCLHLCFTDDTNNGGDDRGRILPPLPAHGGRLCTHAHTIHAALPPFGPLEEWSVSLGSRVGPSTLQPFTAWRSRPLPWSFVSVANRYLALRRVAYRSRAGPFAEVELLVMLELIRNVGDRVVDWKLGIEDATLGDSWLRRLGATMLRHARAMRHLCLLLSGNPLSTEPTHS